MRITRTLLTAAVGTTLVFALAGCGSLNVGPRQTETVSRDFTVGNAPSLLLKSDAGEIILESTDSGKVSVVAEKRAGSREALDQMVLDFKQNGDSIEVRYRRPANLLKASNANVSFRVQAPAGTLLDLETAGGSVEVKGFANGAKVHTSGGSVTTSDLRGNQLLDTSGGSIKVTRAVGDVRVSTSGGSITSTEVKGSQSLTTSGGSIEAVGIDGSVQAETSGGSITLDGRLIGSNRARTSGGSVTARLPAGASLKVTAEGNRVSNDFGIQTTSSSRLAGNIGQGTDGTLDLSTSGGNVDIKKK
jgi:DUF4097 and DUF4098 domain-containing protein YvlB